MREEPWESFEEIRAVWIDSLMQKGAEMGAFL